MGFLESHLVALFVFSGFTSVAMGTLSENTPRERAIAAGKMFLAFVGSTIVGAWIMHFVR
jgi:MFS family permease